MTTKRNFARLMLLWDGQRYDIELEPYELSMDQPTIRTPDDGSWWHYARAGLPEITLKGTIIQESARQKREQPKRRQQQQQPHPQQQPRRPPSTTKVGGGLNYKGVENTWDNDWSRMPRIDFTVDQETMQKASDVIIDRMKRMRLLVAPMEYSYVR